MTPLPIPDEAQADANAVAAIRNGDRERYRELVERYAHKVFAVAWCRLGDRTLAEEAAQEAFIAGFRRLSLLGRADRFGAWITTIARHAAINLGLRQRGELRKRQRWAIETVETTGTESADTAPELPLSTATLRDVVAALPPIHRECLVLFYLENRSVAETARTLGISENACKVRLHRARGVLRETLETRLESGLERLRAPSRLTAAVMLGLPSAPTAWLAVGGAGSWLTKTLPFGTMMLGVQFLGMLPGLALAWWMGRREMANFRDPEGFRGQLYGRFLRTLLPFVGIAALLSIALPGRVGFPTFVTLLGAFTVVSSADSARRTWVVRHPTVIGTALTLPPLAIVALGCGQLGWPYQALFLGQAAFFLAMSWIIPSVAPRMDYSLFLRAVHGLLPIAHTPDRVSVGDPISPPDPRRSASLLAFARFLGRGLLVEDWRRRGTGLELRLARVRIQPFAAILPFYWGPTSRLELRPDGRVKAQLGTVDRAELASTRPAPLPDRAVLEVQVARACASAWDAFASGDLAGARRLLGEASHASIFRRSPERTLTMRWRVWMMRGGAALAVVLGVQGVWFRTSPEFDQAQNLRPVALTETEVRTFLDRLDPSTKVDVAAWEQWNLANLLTSHLPPAEYFSARAWTAVRTNALRHLPGTSLEHPLPPHLLSYALSDATFLHAVEAGMFTSAELDRLGLGPHTLREALRQMPAAEWRRLTELQRFPVKPGVAGLERPHGISQDYEALATPDLARRLRFFSRVGVLDRVDFTPTVAVLKQSQVLPENPLVGRWPGVTNRSQIRGLFVTRFGDLLRDTRDSLVILAAAKALDQIDREACIAGILRLHRGHGRFAPHRTTLGGSMRGEAADTFAALESLALLDALDRVPDAANWEFCPPFRNPFLRLADGAQVLAWEHLESWRLREDARKSRPGWAALSSPAPRASISAAR